MCDYVKRDKRYYYTKVNVVDLYIAFARSVSSRSGIARIVKG